jgi:DNA primase
LAEPLDNDIERPNRIIFDLDPGLRVTWPQVVTAAKLVREVL